MLKNTYLKQLNHELKSLPKKERAEIIDDIQEVFDTGEADGRNNDYISRHLGTPKTLAKTLVADYLLENPKEKTSFTRFFKILSLVMSISFINFCLILSPTILASGIIISLICSGLIGIPVSFFVFVHTTLLTAFFNWALVFGLSVLIARAGWDLGKVFINVLLKYFKWNLSLVKARVKI
ncbi:MULTISPECIES: DUF1700 domain-containing protein [Bacillus amyloliquefaciens group]|uniref:DUF1700 domain-containing protein n=1 Tax=Bacillus amyloliquefaciens group TaxID=1938374 RepID=UPI0021B13823|nr:DUF1700 domain-containing protein [Bacillus velezensis]MCT6684588.1 DUF1700 domain-containing protein [Bacillus velezensis]MCY0092234.1 DUF1700 domain-containing protein [Bacillus velezensis]HEO2443469.1 DUF1700 domain-containing protein [Streptococcus agalactiae]